MRKKQKSIEEVKIDEVLKRLDGYPHTRLEAWVNFLDTPSGSEEEARAREIYMRFMVEP